MKMRTIFFFICFSQKKVLSLQKELVLRKLKGYVDVAHSVDFVGLFFCLFDNEASFILLYGLKLQ